MTALRDGLVRHGFEVVCARTAAEALDRLSTQPDVVLLDLGLPDQDGLKVCARIREESTVPVIMVTARADVRTRIHGLNLGADDYLVKPFEFAELVARIHAVSRRVHAAEPAEKATADNEGGTRRLRIAPDARTVTMDGTPVELTRKEFDVLALLAERPGVVFRREQIISRVWSTDWGGTGRTLEVHIASLRLKLKAPDLIDTVRGIGYRLTDC
jgi:DNA-binding response OmpR family regulator